MRKALPALLLCLLSFRIWAADARVFLPDLLPANTIFCLVPADPGILERDYANSLIQKIGDLPEMGAFIRSFEQSRSALANDIAQAAQVNPQLATELVNSKLGIALINLGLGRDGNAVAEFALSLTLQTPADRTTIYNAVMALLNRPEVVRMVLESQGIDPNLPLKTLAQEENLAGYPPILHIGPNIRVASFGNTVLIYHGPNSEGIRKIFDAAANPNTALSRNPAFHAVYAGAEATRGMSFVYLNLPRLTSILDAMNMGHITRVTDALGLGTVQALGLAGGYQAEGIRHSLFLHVPDGNFTGMMAALAPMPPNSPIGMEGYSSITPSSAQAYMSFRVDLPTLLREFPFLVDALGMVARPGGMGGLVANERFLNVPVQDIIRTLGSDVVIRPHDDTQVAVFNNVDVAGFEQMVGRMEQSAGTRFNQLNVGGYIVRYYNRRASLSSPLAPAFYLIPRQDGSNTGVLYMATHPQAVVSLIQESAAAREPLSQTQDYQKATSGIGGNYSLFYYNNNRDCYRHVYNFLLPVAALWSSSARYPVDTGLLPPADTITPGFFGCALGMRKQADGLVINAYSPIGFNAILVILADKLIVSNPLVIAYTYGVLEQWMKTIPTW